MKSILSGIWSNLKNPAFIGASLVVGIIILPFAVKLARKLPVVGDKLP